MHKLYKKINYEVNKVKKTNNPARSVFISLFLPLGEDTNIETVFNRSTTTAPLRRCPAIVEDDRNSNGNVALNLQFKQE